MWDQNRRRRKHKNAEKENCGSRDLSAKKLGRTRVFSEEQGQVIELRRISERGNNLIK